MEDTPFVLEGPAVTDDTLRTLPGLRKVKFLELLDTAVTDDGCRELLRAHALVEVVITSDVLSGRAIQSLAQLPALRSLLIQRAPRIGDEGLQWLTGHSRLRELYLKQTAVTDEGVLGLGSLPELWSLVLDGTGISDMACGVFSRMPRLSLVGLDRTHVTGHGLTNLPDNEHFGISLEESSATDDGVAAFAKRLSNLKRLCLDHTGVGDSAARVLAQLPRLNDVRFGHTKLTDAGLGAFAGHSCLDSITVEGCAVSAKAVAALKEASPRQLRVYGP